MVFSGFLAGAVLTVAGLLIFPAATAGVSYSTWIFNVLASGYSALKDWKLGRSSGFLRNLGAFLKVSIPAPVWFLTTSPSFVYTLMRLLGDSLGVASSGWLAGANLSALAQLASGALYAVGAWTSIDVLLRGLKAQPMEPEWDGIWDLLQVISRSAGAGVLSVVPFVA